LTAVLLAGVDACVTELPGVGPAAARRLARLGLRTVGELLEHYPRSHEDRRRVTPLPAVEPGRPVVVSAAVTAHRRFGPRGRFLRVELADRTARTALLCFGRSYLARSLPVGTSVTVAATFERRGAMLEASTFEVHHAADSASFGRVVPVYPLTEGLRPALLRRTMLAACARLAGRDTQWNS
jgi:ATP-dependent DNA helicase RecG